MSRSLLADAFAHHIWATQKVIDACLALGPQELATAVPGTFGSILDTMRHLVGGDCSYLNVLTDGQVSQIDEDQLDLAALRVVIAANGPAWSDLLARDLDPDVVIVRYRDDGSESHAPLGIRLAQALDHGTDHRSQICTTLTMLGLNPPEIDAWAFAWSDGRLVEVPPRS
jgi:uncharacterized damage-inducible protein DinB